LGIVSGANQSQIFRSAIGSVGRTQMLAAISIGLTQLKAMRYVILPQALFLAVPGLGSEIALLIKDSAYSFIIGVIELMKHTDILRASQRSLILPYIASAIIYVVMTFPVATYLDKWGTRKKKILGLS
jgi:ABC-type amino acid transport system permease subunit